LENIVHSIDILPSIRSDHNIIKLAFINPDIQRRGPGYWKFNTSLLRDKKYTNLIKETIQNSEMQNKHEDKGIVWELVKIDIRSATIKYCKNSKHKKQKHEESLQKDLKLLHQQITTTNNQEELQNLQEQINAIEGEIISIENEKTAVIIIRSKTRWAEDGKKILLSS
jgi:hypothetical protein